MSQKHSFISYIKNQRGFTLTVFGISVEVGLFINIKQRIQAIINSVTMLMKFSFPALNPFKIKKIKLTFISSLIKLTQYLTMTLKVKRIRLVGLMSQLMKFTLSLILSRPIFIATVKLYSKLGTLSLKVPKTVVSAIPIVAQFIPLWVYDNQYLWQMDNQTLVSMEYTSS